MESDLSRMRDLLTDGGRTATRFACTITGLGNSVRMASSVVIFQGFFD